MLSFECPAFEEVKMLVRNSIAEVTGAENGLAPDLLQQSIHWFISGSYCFAVPGTSEFVSRLIVSSDRDFSISFDLKCDEPEAPAVGVMGEVILADLTSRGDVCQGVK